MNGALSWWAGFEFGQPYWLLLLVGLWPFWRSLQGLGRQPGVPIPSLRLLDGVARPVKTTWARRTAWLRVVVAALLIVALARPRLERGVDDETAHGIDILLVLDASRSMESKDFVFEGTKLSRREGLLRVLADFIQARPQDRIGVVAFAERPFLVSPLTLDHSWMLEAVSSIKLSLGTAIGSGVEAAVDLLRRSESPDKVAIVVTDGLNTSGVKPLESAQTARRFGVRLYTIGIVSYAEMATGAVEELSLSQMARMTGGQFFQAADGAGLQAIYRQIDAMERTAFKQPRLRAWRELFPWLVGAAALLVLLDLVLAQARAPRLP